MRAVCQPRLLEFLFVDPKIRTARNTLAARAISSSGRAGAFATDNDQSAPHFYTLTHPLDLSKYRLSVDVVTSCTSTRSSSELKTNII